MFRLNRVLISFNRCTFHYLIKHSFETLLLYAPSIFDFDLPSKEKEDRAQLRVPAEQRRNPMHVLRPHGPIG